jgi:hypothetical protein
VIHLFDKTGCKKPCNFYPNSLLFVLLEPPQLLLDGFCLGVDVQGVLDPVSRYTGHVQWFPSEHAYVLSQEPDEHVFLFGVKV